VDFKDDHMYPAGIDRYFKGFTDHDGGSKRQNSSKNLCRAWKIPIYTGWEL